jgi:hypothetical protein
MAIPSRQIGWGTEDNLLWQISKQLERLTCVTAGGCGAITTTTTSTVAPTTTTTTTLPVYRVFTALLTQTGGDSPTLVIDLPLVPGITYEIIDNDGSTADFTNVGAPNNNVGTFFVATGSTPNSWGDNLLGQLQFNAGAPVATILENTIGNIWFTYDNQGIYKINNDSNLFIVDKTFFYIYQFLYNTSPQFIEILTGSDGNLLNTPTEIRVYN